MATRTRKTTAKKTTPASAAKKTTSPARKPAAKTLPKRPTEWMTDGQGYATVAALIAGITTNCIQDWTDHRDGTVTRALTDGTLHYNTRTRTLRWQATCRMGAVHSYRIDDPSMAAAARVRAAQCSHLHADLTGVQPLNRDELEDLGIHVGPTWARRLPGDDVITETLPVPAEQVARARSSAADTQPLSRDEITAGLTARADNETPKGHPEP